MDREKKASAEVSQEEDYSVKGNRRFSLLAYIVCVFAAIVIWLVIMNNPDQNAGAAVPEETGATQVVSVADGAL